LDVSSLNSAALSGAVLFRAVVTRCRTDIVRWNVYARPAFVAGAGLASALWFVVLSDGARLLAPLFVCPAVRRVLDALISVTMLAIAAGLAAHGLR
jgi:arginine exporter protein ArgO